MKKESKFPLHIVSSNAVWHHATVTRERRESLNQHRSAIVWFTGLSGSGKSTIAHEVEEQLHQRGCRTYVLDGDNVRHGLCGDLSFSASDRTENIRRIGHVAKLFLDAGVIVLTAFISPYKSDRQLVRNMVTHNEFFEIHCNAPLAICEQRDIKGLYRKAREGKITDFTGISAPYETPDNPELVVDSGTKSIDECTAQVIQLLNARNIFTS